MVEVDNEEAITTEFYPSVSEQVSTSTNRLRLPDHLHFRFKQLGYQVLEYDANTFPQKAISRLIKSQDYKIARVLVVLSKRDE